MEIITEENEINTADFYLSLKRIEFLMEQMVLQKIQNSTISKEEINEKFKLVLKKVDNSITEDILTFPHIKKVALN